MNPPRFSVKEKEVIGRLLEGKSNKQIAQELGVSVRTVEFHLSNIYARLDARSRTEAVLKLTKMNLRESTGENTGHVLRKSAVAKTGRQRENGKNQIRQKFPMKNLLIGIIAGVILTLIVAFALSTMEILKTSLASSTTETPTAIATETFTPYIPNDDFSTSAAETASSVYETQWAPTSFYYTQAAASGIYPLAIPSDTPTPVLTQSTVPKPLPTFAFASLTPTGKP